MKKHIYYIMSFKESQITKLGRSDNIWVRVSCFEVIKSVN